MTRYEDARGELFEQKIDLLLIEWIENWIANGGSEQGFATEVLRRISRANQIRKGKRPVEAMGTPLPVFFDEDGSENEQGHASGAEGPQADCPAQQVSVGQSRNAESQLGFAHRSTNEQGHSRASERPALTFPAQQENGLDHGALAEGQARLFQPVTRRDPTDAQNNGVINAKKLGARSLFDRLWCGKAIGDHSWYSLSAINRESRAVIEAIGPVPEGDKHRSIRELLCYDESRLRAALASAGRKINKAA